MTRTPRSRRPVARTLIVAAAAVGLITAGVSPALATAPTAVPAATGQTGWLRVAHLSPDTKAVDLQLTALSGGKSVFELDNVTYGAVSGYQQVEAGTYVIAMVPSDAEDGAPPVISASVKIEQGKTVTVAAYGENTDLQTKVFQDDLTNPEAGTARIRLIQASTITERVDVETSTGLLIAKDAAAGSSTSYASVPAGPWELELTASGIDDSASVDLPNGSVNTLFVLDNADGGLTVMPVLDSASVGSAPIGGVQTGGGALGDVFIDISPHASGSR